MSDTAHQNIIDTFLKAAAESPERLALVQDGSSISYGQLCEEVKTAAAYYQSRGLKRGDMVLVFVPMSIPLYRVVLALFYLGAVPVFIDEWVSVARLRDCLKVVPCIGLIAKPTYLLLSFFIGPLRKIPVRISAKKCTQKQQIILPPTAVSGSDTALVTFTTGSTGIPKAANRTHDFLYAQLAALQPLLQDVASPCMTLLPIVVLLHFASGKTAILPPARFKAGKPKTIRHLANPIAHNDTEAIIASPAIIAMLISTTGNLSNALRSAFTHIKTVITGGGPVYPALAKQMRETFGAATIKAVYGSTEAEPISHIDAAELAGASLDILLTKGLPVGAPDPFTEVAILKMDAEVASLVDIDAFTFQLCHPGTPGEVIVAGAHVLRHYINNPFAEAQTKMHIDGKIWHRTGDCGLLDDDGRLYLLGRCAERFIWNGRAYYPAIISYGLQVLAGITDSALLLKDGAPLLVLEQADKPALSTVKDSLASLHLIGAAILFIRKIPKDPRHQTKVDYAQLRQILARKNLQF